MDSGVQFATVGNTRIAYQTHGSGPLDIVYMSGSYSHIDILWEEPRYRHFIEGLTRFGRVIRFDRRGSGVSDPLPAEAGESWEAYVDDLKAVLDDAGSEQAAIFATTDAGPTAFLFAATHPSRTKALILFNTTAKFTAAEDYPQGHTPETADLVVDTIRQIWGTEASTESFIPSMATDERFRRWYARFQRAVASPLEIAENLARILRMDGRHVLPAVQCPTLVLHRSNYAVIPPQHGRYMAESIPGAVFEELPGSDATAFTEGADAIVARIGRFIGAMPEAEVDDRMLATVMFTDIVKSTDRLVALGDRRGMDILDAHDSITREQLEIYRGRLIKSTGDGILATFEAPSRAIRCAVSLCERLREVGVDVRTGLHSGEIEVRTDGDVGGVGVHVAARVMSKAEQGEVLASRTVRDLVTGGDVVFRDRGLHELKGLPEQWQLFSVEMTSAHR